VKRVQRGASRRINTIGSLALSMGALILLPSLSATEAQSSKQTACGETKNTAVENGVDALQQFSTSMELLSKRVSPSVVQIFSTGYSLDTDREHSNTNLFSRRSSSGSGIIIAADGWIVTNAHVVEGSRRIRVRLNQEVSKYRHRKMEYHAMPYSKPSWYWLIEIRISPFSKSTLPAYQRWNCRIRAT
jgi:S1-C subfamily serine protease